MSSLNPESNSARTEAPLLEPDSLSIFLVRALPPLVKRAPAHTLKMVAAQVNCAIDRDVAPSLRRYSSLWRSAVRVEEHSIETRRDHTNVLVTALYNSVALAIESNVLDFRTVADVLLSFRRPIFRRILLQIVTEHKGSLNDYARRYAMSPAYFNEYDVRREYWQLVKRVFDDLTPRERARLFDAIDRGTLSQRKKTVADNGSAESIALKELVKRERLAALEDFLSREKRDELSALIDRRGPPSDDLSLDRVPQAITIGPEAPFNGKLIESSTPVEVATLLRQWQPPEGPDPTQPTREGASRILQRAVAKRPEEFALKARHFVGLDPTYIRGLLSGLHDALRQSAKFSWPPVLKLATFVSEQSSTIRFETQGLLDRDPDWSWAKRAGAFLILDGLNSSSNPISFGLRIAIWSALHPLTSDPDPNDETNQDSSKWSSRALNSVRGMAMTAIIAYARWVCTTLQSMEMTAASSRPSFDTMPEVRDVLDRHLRDDVERSPAIRSVYGQHFRLLHAIDRDWTLKHVASIFGDPYVRAAADEAAWRAFLGYDAVFPAAFDALKLYYVHAVERASLLDDECFSRLRDDSGSRDHLFEHLYLFYLWDKTRLRGAVLSIADVADSLPGAARAHTMWFAGSMIATLNRSGNSVFIDRARAYIEDRIAVASADDPNAVRELSAFGVWFRDDNADDAWALEQLGRVLLTIRKIDDALGVVERLEQLANRYPAAVLGCIELIAKSEKDPSMAMVVHPNIGSLVDRFKDTPEYADVIGRITSHMLAKGYLHFSSAP